MFFSCYICQMEDIKRKTAGYLLQSKAIILEPAKPFTWASGWLSPIYCDNRITLSYPEIRNFIKEAFRDTIVEYFGTSDIIAGVATGAIAQGALVADRMGLPFVYVRSFAKEHGRKNLVEGKLEPGQRVVLVEDLVSTGGSSLKAVEAIEGAGGVVLGMVAIFTYGFQLAEESFRRAGVELHTLTDYRTLIEMALGSGYVKEEQLEVLEQWRKNPSKWKSP
jgi:orotate phosphoribosyltransferase